MATSIYDQNPMSALGFDEFLESLLTKLTERTREICRGHSAETKAPTVMEAGSLMDGLELPEEIVGMGERLGLSRAEQELLALVLAPHYSRDIACIYGMMAQYDGPMGLTRDVLAAVYGVSLLQLERLREAALKADGVLHRMELFCTEGSHYLPSEALRSLLNGREELQGRLAAFAEWRPSSRQQPILPAELDGPLALLKRSWRTSALPPLTCLVGRLGSGRTMIAAQLAHQRELSLIVVHLDQVPEGFDFKALEREALWLGAALMLRAHNPAALDRWAKSIIELNHGQVPVMLGLEHGPSRAFHVQAHAFARLDVPMPNAPTRTKLWAYYLPTQVRVEGLSDERLAFRFRGTGGDIARLARLALDEAMIGLSPTGVPKVSLEQLQRLTHTLLAGRLSGLGTFVVPLPEGLSAIVVPEERSEQIREVLTRAQRRQVVMEHWGFAERRGHGLGHVVLMSGPPGTGKTLTARAVASELEVPLYRVDLSQLVSKWVGETEKNLAAVFDDAELSGSAILFDEADAMFSKRSGVSSSNDRNANLEVGYLLQRIEQFSGICFLTTNLDSSIDPAFERRVSMHIRFTLPERSERKRLWRRAIPHKAPVCSDIDFEELASKFEEISGSDIFNACLRAAFIAAHCERRIDQDMLSYAITTELAVRGKLVQRLEPDPSWELGQRHP
ncbi:MAG: ATP-binding protein [Myxococcota bacterium]